MNAISEPGLGIPSDGSRSDMSLRPMGEIADHVANSF